MKKMNHVFVLLGLILSICLFLVSTVCHGEKMPTQFNKPTGSFYHEVTPCFNKEDKKDD